VIDARFVSPFRPFIPTLLFIVLAFAPPAGAQVPGTGQVPPGTEAPRRAPLTLTPSIGVLEEYNDNIFFDNANRHSDFITSLVPAIALAAENPVYRLIASYDFTARIYARNPDQNRAPDRQDFSLDSLYRFSPEFSVSLSDIFRFTTGVNVLTPDGVSTGFDRYWSNTLRPGASLQIDPLTVLRGSAGWSVLRFERQGLLDSDTYASEIALDRSLTSRLHGILGYDFTYFDVRSFPNVTTNTPRVGASYQFTPTLTASFTAGPTFEHTQGGGDRVTPAATGQITQRLEFGSIGLAYDRRVNTSGALGGVSDNQTISANVRVVRVARGLTLDVSPYYRTLHSPDNSIDVRSFAIPLQAAWQFTPWFSITGGYVFFQQRSDSTVRNPITGLPIATDVDQNRVFLGLVFGYPIKFD
jgi:hypothetical protein